MRVLAACEYSGTVRDAFTKQGHDAWSCDLLPSDAPGDHIQGDVLEVLSDDWDLVIAHPPCTFLCNSGVQHLSTDPARWGKMLDGAAFFKAIADCGAPRLCIENPVMHGHAKEAIGRGGATQVIQPWMFGHTEQKATCLWLWNLPPLQPTKDVEATMNELPDSERQRLHWLSPGPTRWKERSKTYQGIADAMAAQWGIPCEVQDTLFPIR